MSFYANKNNKYTQTPELVLDFHGYTTFECKEVLDELVVSHEYSHVRIIVGKGKNSTNGPILPDFVKNYLVDNNIRFNTSKIQDGGEGALEVFLK
jgi:DNA-nicking Smr family endonuclease